MFAIGPYTVTSRTLLAPMAGVTDLPFRKICRNFGAGLATAEMLTSDTRLWQSNKSQSRLRYDNEAAPISIQIAGSDPALMAQAAQEAVARGAQIIDINMGCPAKKVCKKLAGSALMKDEALVTQILRAVVSNVDVPVTLKTRTGWDQNHKNCVTIAKIAEDNGISALTIHGRTRACRFQGQAEYDTIAELIGQVAIPVIANGDIDSPEKADAVLKYTGAAAVMLGRAAHGRPWLFRQVNAYLESGQLVPEPSIAEKRQVLEEHLQALYKFYGEWKGVRVARKHYGWYCQYLPVTTPNNKVFNQLESSAAQLAMVREKLNNYEDQAA